MRSTFCALSAEQKIDNSKIDNRRTDFSEGGVKNFRREAALELHRVRRTRSTMRGRFNFICGSSGIEQANLNRFVWLLRIHDDRPGEINIDYLIFDLLLWFQ